MTPAILISGGSTGCESYCQAILAAGGTPTPSYCPEAPVEELLARHDGLLLAGGGDMDPSYFGQKNQGSTDIDPKRDEVEWALAKAFLAAGKPILGICRGSQVLNIVLGGNLIQALEEPRVFRHVREEGKDKAHPTTISPDSWLGKLFGESAVTNSSHHQAVNKMGKGLIPCQWSDDGVIEGFQHESLPVYAVQWHPERTCLEYVREDTINAFPIFEFFIGKCKETK